MDRQTCGAEIVSAGRHALAKFIRGMECVRYATEHWRLATDFSTKCGSARNKPGRLHKLSSLPHLIVHGKAFIAAETARRPMANPILDQCKMKNINAGVIDHHESVA